MRKAIAIPLLIGLLAGAMVAPADAAKKKAVKKIERVIEHAYSAPSPGIGGAPYSACLAAQMDDAGCVNIPLGAAEKYVNVEIADAAGQGVYWILAQDTDTSDTDVGYDIFHYGCGNSEEPIKVTEGLELRISVYAFGGPTCPAPATTGSIKATLSNTP
ncbi:MAG TPA: hypothetical protein VJ927_10910 [Actinomycetota bacterium]|nr:hypothetical protein [Actinomycetota bacterium]